MVVALRMFLRFAQSAFCSLFSILKGKVAARVIRRIGGDEVDGGRVDAAQGQDVVHVEDRAGDDVEDEVTGVIPL